MLYVLLRAVQNYNAIFVNCELHCCSKHSAVWYQLKLHNANGVDSYQFKIGLISPSVVN